MRRSNSPARGSARAEPATGEALGKPGPGAKGQGAPQECGEDSLPSPGSQEGALLRSLAGLGVRRTLGNPEEMGRPPLLNTTI